MAKMTMFASVLNKTKEAITDLDWHILMTIAQLLKIWPYGLHFTEHGVYLKTE